MRSLRRTWSPFFFLRLFFGNVKTKQSPADRSSLPKEQVFFLVPSEHQKPFQGRLRRWDAGRFRLRTGNENSPRQDPKRGRGSTPFPSPTHTPNLYRATVRPYTLLLTRVLCVCARCSWPPAGYGMSSGLHGMVTALSVGAWDFCWSPTAHHVKYRPGLHRHGIPPPTDTLSMRSQRCTVIEAFPVTAWPFVLCFDHSHHAPSKRNFSLRLVSRLMPSNKTSTYT
ncbi:hypothetical protein B0H67DRAFT_331233 [Lasiosphaeris hirsuta]|uniref:Secreted protein n=1 Tax=Lasiosphaeris hirsuta TaxID=260670 RepID=A0AA40A2N4_9PEZI|nr:hypothetical protein B0H67DRAFT_331233 [Lasiosphaeris hirsuta]